MYHPVTPLVREAALLLARCRGPQEAHWVVELVHDVVLDGKLPVGPTSADTEAPAIDASPRILRSHDDGTALAVRPAAEEAALGRDRLLLHARILLQKGARGSLDDRPHAQEDPAAEGGGGQHGDTGMGMGGPPAASTVGGEEDEHSSMLSAFYWQAFPHLSDVLLSVVGEWLDDSCWGARLTRLLGDLYGAAPAPCALASLVGHLSSVVPVGSGWSTSNVQLAAPGTDAALQLLAARFGGPSDAGLSAAAGPRGAQQCDGAGLEELLLYLAAAGRCSGTKQQEGSGTTQQLGPGSAMAPPLGWPPLLLPSLGPAGSATQPHPLLAGPEALAGLLATLPDRAAATGHLEPQGRGRSRPPGAGPKPSSDDEASQPPLGSLSSPRWYCHVLQRLLRAHAQPVEAEGAAVRAMARRPGAPAAVALGGYEPPCPMLHGSAALPEAAAELAAAVVERACTRGHARAVAAALVQHLTPLQPGQCGALSGDDSSQAGCGRACSQPDEGAQGGASSGSGSGGAANAAGTQLQVAAVRDVVRRLRSHGRCLEQLVEQVLLLLSPACLFPTHLSPQGQYEWLVQRKQQQGQQGQQQEPGQQPSPWSAAVRTMHLLLGGPALTSPEMRYLLTERCLLHRTLPLPCLLLLLEFLAWEDASWQAREATLDPSTGCLPAFGSSSSSSNGGGSSGGSSPCMLADVAATVARVWSDPCTASKMPLTQQGYLSHSLGLLLCHVSGSARGPAGQQQALPQSVLPFLLQGVSQRLGSCLVSQRSQAMRIGRLFSRAMDPGSELFADQGSLDWTAEEMWEGAVGGAPPAAAQGSGATAASGLQQPSQGPEAPDSDDDSDDDVEAEDDDVGLKPFGLEEDLEAEGWKKAEPRSLQLRSIATALRKADDAPGVLAALSRLEVLVRACPDELALLAPELVRALMHCRLPEWAEAEAKSPDASPEAQRLRCLAALAALAPLPAGDTLLAELYSPHIDTFQRLLILDSLTAASFEMSHQGSAPRLELPAPGSLTAAPYVVYPGQGQGRASAAPPLPPPGCDQPRGAGRGTAAGSSSSTTRDAGRTRVWGQVALRKRGQPQPQALRNLFADVSLRWAAGILREVDVVRHGVDLLGRDSLLLGRVLATLASFSEHASGSHAAVPLASATLELLRSPQVHAHEDPYVRRASLLAVGQVVASLPAASVAAALLASGSGGTASLVGRREAPRRRPGSSVADEGLLERLEWVQAWVRSAAQQDSDETCRMMAEACVNIQAGAAAQALESLSQAPQHAAGSALGRQALGGPAGLGLPLIMPGSAWPGLGVSVGLEQGPAIGVLPGRSSGGKAPLVVEIAGLSFS